MSNRVPPFRLSLRTLLLWVIPWVATCLLILTSCRRPWIDPGGGEIPLFHWAKLLAVFIVTVLWAVLLWEDSRVMRKQRDADRE